MKKLLALLLCLALCTAPALAVKGEVVNPADLPILPPTSSDWAKTELAAAQEVGLLVDSLGPDFTVDITREQFAELVVNLVTHIYGEGPEATPTGTFTDTENPAILQAYAIGIVNGVGNGKFDPAATTNREQIACMLYRAIRWLENEMGDAFLLISPDISAFSDKTSVSSWATEGVGALAANGIMKGTSDTTVSPQSSCTVEQSILLVYRIYAMLTPAG